MRFDDPLVVRELLRKHQLPDEEPVRATKEGIVHATWFCGDSVVRILKEPEELPDVLTEADAAPAAWKAGIRTPKVIVHDLQADPPYSILERAPGKTLSTTNYLPDPDEFFFDLGREIRRIHEEVTEVPTRYLDEAWIVMPEDVASHGQEYAELVAKLDWQPHSIPVLAHQDLHADNILVHEGRLTAILDWGDAGYGDPAADFRYLPARHLPAAFEGYGADPALRHRAILHQLDQHFEAQERRISYGPFGDSSREDLVNLINAA